MASGVIENIALNLAAEVIVKCCEIGWNVYNDPQNAFRGNRRIKTRLRAQIAIWEAIQVSFENPLIQKHIKEADIETYHQIMVTLHELLVAYVKRKCQNSEEQKRILATTELTEAIKEAHHTTLDNHLALDEKKAEAKLWNRFTAEVRWVWRKSRDETLIAQMEQWGVILDKFSSHVLPAIIPVEYDQGLVIDVMPQTTLVTQVRRARLANITRTPQANIPLSDHDQTDFIIDADRVRSPVKFERSTRDDLPWELGQRSDLGGSGRRQWIKFQNADGTCVQAILEFKVAPSPAERMLYTDTNNFHAWNITEENAKVIRTLRLASQHTDTFRVLYCEGIYSQDDYFGFIYQLPPLSPTWQPQSLGNILLNPKFKSALSRNLESRLELARALTWTVLELHQVELVHESIHPDNILIFGSVHPSGSVDFDWSQPYLVGFDCSRQQNGVSGKLRNNPGHWTWRVYTHPLRQLHQYNRFEKVFDIYSLGVVLLEVGFMSSFMEQETLTKFQGWMGDPNKFKEFFIETALKLESMWGPGYKEVVLTCLNGQFGYADDVYALASQFKTRVCDKLDQINLS